MILYTQSTIEQIITTESGETVWYIEFKNHRQEIIHRGLCNDEEAEAFIKTGAKDLTDKNKNVK